MACRRSSSRIRSTGTMPALHLSRRARHHEVAPRAQQHYFCDVAASTGALLALLLCFSNHANR
jgi:hypothetical protein